jgi:hypothetical protein
MAPALTQPASGSFSSRGFSSSGNLAIPAAIFLASSFVMRFAAARRPGFDFKVDIRHRRVIGGADDVGDAAIFLDGPWWETAIGLFGHDRDLCAATYHRLTVRVAHLFAAD